MSTIKVLENFSEIITYNDPDIPICVAETNILKYREGMLCHWHEDIEYIKAAKGRMYYCVNNEKILLEEGQGMLINSRQLHYGVAINGESCVYHCVVFQPEVLSGAFTIQREYIRSITDTPKMIWQLLEPDCEIMRCMEEVIELYNEKPAGYVLRALSCLSRAWAAFYEAESSIAERSVKNDPDIPLQKSMVEFIRKNYDSDISLADIARAGGVCKSKCCSIFKKYLNKTPKGFLYAYRLEAASCLLRETSMPVSEVASACGFNSPSYFSESFMKLYGCTPREYRSL